MANEFYRFNPIKDHEGKPGKYQKQFVDEKDFAINPVLLKQIDFDKCRETTPEGKALWIYFRLCQLLQYDEGYFYSYNRNHPNDDPYKSFEIVEKVTASTPTTCFNFSRIAVKLLNQIQGVHALIISAGDNLGHFRVGYYTDKVSVDLESTAPLQHFNDLARAKLGLRLQGLHVYEGTKLMLDLAQRLTDSLLLRTRRNLHKYIGCLQQLQQETPQESQIALEPLIAMMKKYGVDGGSAVQFLISMNHQFNQKPYDLMRAGLYDEKNRIQPQMLVRENATLRRIDLNQMQVFAMTDAEYSEYFRYGDMIYPDGGEDRFFQFSADLHASQKYKKTTIPSTQMQVVKNDGAESEREL